MAHLLDGCSVYSGMTAELCCEGSTTLALARNNKALNHAAG